MPERDVTAQGSVYAATYDEAEDKILLSLTNRFGETIVSRMDITIETTIVSVKDSGDGTSLWQWVATCSWDM